MELGYYIRTSSHEGQGSQHGVGKTYTLVSALPSWREDLVSGVMLVGYLEGIKPPQQCSAS